MGIFSSCLCILAVFSPFQLSLPLQFCGALCTEHQTSCSWRPCSPLCPGGFGKNQAQGELALPWQQKLELWTQPALYCPSDLVEPIGASSYGVFQSLYLPFLFCLGFGWDQAGVRLVPKQSEGWQDLPWGSFPSFFPVSIMSHAGQQPQNWACLVQLWNLEPVLAGNRNWNRSLGKYSPLP